tara:strand:- start:283 stop:1581 length:1299 start_codon:yes stop_codon:yes gene_type:complete
LSALLKPEEICHIPTAEAFEPFLEPARYKGAFGGRASGKTHFFGGLGVERCYVEPTRMVCIREVQKDLKDSSMQVMMDKIEAHGFSKYYQKVQGEIRGANGSIIIFKGMTDYTADSIKSLEGYDIAWVAEAQSLSQDSLDKLRPTIRKDNSELWFDWNPDNEFDPVDNFFRGLHAPADSIVRRVNWHDNPWLPKVMRTEMEEDRAADPDKAAHIWGGEYRQAPKGAHYAALLAKAITEDRVTTLPHEPAAEVHVSFDLGVGANQALWFAQFVGNELRIIDYLQGDEEAANEGYAWFARKMREKDYTYGKIYFPHDGRVREATGKSRAETMENLKFKVEILPMLPVQDGIDAVKRTFPKIWVDSKRCAEGLKSVKNYRDNWDEKLGRSNGPLKDWTNHAADSLRYIVQAYEAPSLIKPQGRGQYRGREGSWMR